MNQTRFVSSLLTFEYQHETEAKNFSISVAGYELESARELENKEVTASSPLSPNSLRLLIYVKK